MSVFFDVFPPKDQFPTKYILRSDVPFSSYGSMKQPVPRDNSG